jgi:PhoH-like ATPase
MPLPPAPTKRASRVDLTAKSPRKTTPRKAPAASPSAVADLAPAPEIRAVAAPNGKARPTPRKRAEAPPPVEARPAPMPAVQPEAAQPARQAKPAKPAKKAGPPKLFVLDTNVLLHDPTALFRFQEHDIYLPMIVLEELDAHKKGMTEVARNGRQTSRLLDALVATAGDDLTGGITLSATGNGQAAGRLYFQTGLMHVEQPEGLPEGKADNQILGVVAALATLHAPRDVILVSKDINMRVKARALGLAAEDYENDKVLADGDLLYSGALALPSDFWTRQGKALESWQSGAHTFYRVRGPVTERFLVNQFVYYEAPGEPPMYARVTELRDDSAVLKTLKDYTHPKNAVWGVTARNREQNFALNLLMDPDVDFVSLAGTAGTGKTLMALAAGLTQVLDERRYTEIIMTRATVSVGEDIGFLPGTEEEKMGPWMGALDDNLEFLAKGDAGGAGEWGRASTNDLIRSRIKIKSMNFMRGRTFMNKWIILDEAQNLTPKQMKTLITRAGPGTKIICMGNLAQIDTPYLTEGSSGLTYAVDRFKGWPYGGHITLARGERSRLADYASEVL